MPQYTIAAVSPNVRDVPLDHGLFKSYRLRMEGHGEKVFEILQKAETPAPQAGQSFEATIKNVVNVGGTEITNLKKVQAQGGGGGSRGGAAPKSPEERASIEKQVAAKVAGDLLVAFLQSGKYAPGNTQEVAEDHRLLSLHVAETIRT